ncbi:MAG: metallophosphoesterase, partial [Bacteroidota bacterium]
IAELRPKKIYFLGDLFHSVLNREWYDFLQFLDVHPKVDFTLVEGNHDIIKQYPERLRVVRKLNEYPFSFTHHEDVDEIFYNFSGHVHPGISLYGKAREGITLPCFVFGKEAAMLPAFGQFTGLKKIKPEKTDAVFVVAEGSVFRMQ